MNSGKPFKSQERSSVTYGGGHNGQKSVTNKFYKQMEDLDCS